MIRAVHALLPAALLAIAGAAMADPPAATPAATAQATATTTVTPATVQPKPEDKMICKTETPIGSRLGGHRTCMKKSEWDQQSRTAQQYFSQRIGGGTNSH